MIHFQGRRGEMIVQTRTLSLFLFFLASGVESQTSFTKDFSANLQEVKKFGGDFIPKFDFENFFKEVDEASSESESPREARRESYPEPYVNPYDPVDPQKKVDKVFRQKIVEPTSANAGFEPTSQKATSRVDRQNPLFRGTVEQVLDNRNLKPERQPEEYLAPGPPYNHYDVHPSHGEFESRGDDFKYSVPSKNSARQDSLTARKMDEPESRADRKSDRPGLVSAFVQQPFRVPSEFRSQIGFDSDELTGFKAPFGESGSGFADFLRQVGNRPDAFGPANFNDKNDRIVADDIDEAIRKGHRQYEPPRQNVKRRRPSQRRNNFDDSDDDVEFDDSDDDDEEEERRFVVGNYKPTFRRTTHERESDQSYFTYDKNKDSPAQRTRYEQRPFQYNYHSHQDFRHKPEFSFTNERSDEDSGFQSIFNPSEPEIEPPTFNYRESFTPAKPEVEKYPVLPVESSEIRRQEDSEPNSELLKITESIVEQQTSKFRGKVDVVNKDNEPNIKNGFFSNYEVQDFTKVKPTATATTTTTTATTTTTQVRVTPDVSLPRNSDLVYELDQEPQPQPQPQRRQQPQQQPTFGFRPFEDFNSFFANDIRFEAGFDTEPSSFFKLNDEPRGPTTQYGRETTVGETTADTTTPSTPSTATTTYTTTASTTSSAVITTITTEPKSVTELTPSTVYYKPYDKNDPKYTPGPIFYKPIELVTVPSAFYTTTSVETTGKSTTDGWKPKVGDYFVDFDAASKTDSYGAPISKSDITYGTPKVEPYVAPKSDSTNLYTPPKPEAESYEAPKTETYTTPKVESYEAPKVETYEAPKVDSYEAPKAESSESYSAPKAEPYVAPNSETYGAPKVESIDSYGSPKAESIDSYGSPKAEPLDSYGSPKAEPIQASTVPPSSPPPAPAPAGGQAHHSPPRNQRPRGFAPLNRVIGNVRKIVDSQASRLRNNRNHPIAKSAGVLWPYAASVLNIL